MRSFSHQDIGSDTIIQIISEAKIERKEITTKMENNLQHQRKFPLLLFSGYTDLGASAE
jgi:hypothetical protein